MPMPMRGQLDLITPTDNVIVVLGATGVGKSTLVGLITGTDQSLVGHKLHSCTERVQAVRCSRNGRDYVFLDTPGFDDTKMSDVQVLAEISSWLVSTYKKGVNLSGLLYLQRITDNRYTDTSRRNTEMFMKLCGQVALRNVVLVTTMWGEVDEEIGANREEELRTKFWKSMLDSGSQMTRFKQTSESAWEIVELLSGLQRQPLRLQIEIGDEGRDLSQTAAGKTLFAWLTKMIAELREIMRRLKDLLASKKGEEDPLGGGSGGDRGALQDELLATEERARRTEEQMERIRPRLRSRSFADAVRGIGLSRSPSSSLVATPSSRSAPSLIGSPISRMRSFSSSVYSDALPSPASSSYDDSASDQWLAALKSGLGLVTTASEIPPVPFLKGVAGLSLKIVEMVDATRRTDKTLKSLKKHARAFSTLLETHMTTPHLSEGVREALEDLVKDLLAVERVLARMSTNGLVHRYALQSNDQHILSNCASRLQEAHMSFLTKCIVSIASDVGAIRANQGSPEPVLLIPVINPPTFEIIGPEQQTHQSTIPPPIPRLVSPTPKPQYRTTM